MLDPTLPDFFGMIYGRRTPATLTHTEGNQNMNPQDADYFGFGYRGPAFTTGIKNTAQPSLENPITQENNTPTENSGTP